MTFVFVVSFAAVASVARAQMYETIGIRAQGMGGAFVAVADDATATWWNPAGLASGAYFNTLIEYDRPDNPPDAPSETNVQAVALAFPAFGLSYYRVPISHLRPPNSTVDAATGRQDQGYLSQFGATFGQSIGSHLVIATTVKLLHASETHGDLDIGALATLGHVRAGVTLRNVHETSFGDEAHGLSLERAVRAGAAITGGGGRLLDAVTAAVDADLTKVTTILGEGRHVSAGVEAWMFSRVVGVRGGLSRETVNSLGARSVGLSLMVQASRYMRTYLDGQLTGGSDEARRGWGVDLRVTF